MPTPMRSSNGLTAVEEVDVQGPGVACGVLLPNVDPATSVPPRDQFRQAARLAEQLEFESVWAADHFGPALDAATCLAAVAAVTDRIALGFSATPLAARNPAWTAKQLTSIDLLAGGGRLRIGVGFEFPPFDAAAPVSEHAALLDDSLAVIADLITGRPVEYTGRALTVHAPALEPALGAVPPIYVGGRGEAALRRAARYGEAWVPGRITPAEIAESSQLLGEMALELGRPAPRIAALVPTPLGSIDGAVEHLHQFVELGVSEIVLVTLGDDPLQQYERLAEVRARLRAPAAASGTAP